jgi:hypothetical protein
MAPKIDPLACKVTMQYRSTHGRVYELESAGVMLDVHVTQQQASEKPGEWLVAAQSGRTADAVVIAETAITRTEALRKVGCAWVAQAPELGLPAFDWTAVTNALLSVRAI